ncbi:nucleoside 2-deoxyribosyltransferase [Glaciibacter psychrotolerans]|uniref:Nucleoside 2-deoxyribosyltransferase n=1 Tax=Glaciibacter psychrotolerans TaxID=670054 RepID=A0A7Z0EBN9_9MICO|nr:nucleoside 2-deoxyribosyltransferase [Leifsonia psychrotolerans]NYJ18654.1 nucleoside 2-deoxyribosyltransferase [Leifsonia psychrotolerans]
MATTPRIYLAGFDVFYPDAHERALTMKAMCQALGLEGVFPADVEIDPTGLTDAEFATAIFTRDVQLIDDCDIVAANLNAFRGVEPDSGTCFEMGYGYARGKALYAYTAGPSTIVERVRAFAGEVRTNAQGIPVDDDGLHIENFGSPVNLMLSIPSTVTHGTFEDCLQVIARDFRTLQS